MDDDSQLEDDFIEVDVAGALVEGMQQMVALQQQQIQLMAALAQQLAALGAPKRVVRDAQGRIVGVEPVQGV